MVVERRPEGFRPLAQLDLSAGSVQVFAMFPRHEVEAVLRQAIAVARQAGVVLGSGPAARRGAQIGEGL